MAFLQARMGSTRLPGKVLMPIQGQSILERAIRRLKASPAVDEVVVLTSCRDVDDVVEAEAGRLRVPAYRGPELDVLARFYGAAVRFRPEIIVRATADNPLIDIGSIARIVTALRSRRLDLCMESGLPYGAATEAVTAEALTRAHLESQTPRDREHVTLYIKEHPESFRVGYLRAPEPVRFPDLRVTVDTCEDFLFVQNVICRLPENDAPLPLDLYIPHALNIMDEKRP